MWSHVCEKESVEGAPSELMLQSLVFDDPVSDELGLRVCGRHPEVSKYTRRPAVNFSRNSVGYLIW